MEGYFTSLPMGLARRIATMLVIVFLISLQHSSFDILQSSRFPLRSNAKYWLRTIPNSESMYTTYSGGSVIFIILSAVWDMGVEARGWNGDTALVEGIIPLPLQVLASWSVVYSHYYNCGGFKKRRQLRALIIWDNFDRLMKSQSFFFLWKFSGPGKRSFRSSRLRLFKASSSILAAVNW